MHKKSLRETIKEITNNHLLEENGLVMGQCLTAVGWVGGTLPELHEKDGMVDISMADVAGGGFAVGAALAGRKPMYVIRYQGFNWYNSVSIINYAAKSKELWDVPCSIFVRSIAMEGGIGPVAGSSHHSLYYRMPGITIVSPMTPKEYIKAYNDFMNSDGVFYISEHRKSYDMIEDMEDILNPNPDITLFAISITRFSAIEASNLAKKLNIIVNVVHIYNIKPLSFSESAINSLINSKYGGIVLDDDYVNGIAKSIANDLNHLTNKKVNCIGLEDKTAGFYSKVDNLPPDAKKIIEFICNVMK
ncbi:hypothetical protein N9Z35_04370 [Alphaproteobacteria bacterium]|nr:hypothetical protein [Alphaproteobacteria bacterium]